MQRLVERSAGRVEPLGEDVDRDAVERDRDEHLALVGAEPAADRVAQGAEQLALGGVLVGDSARDAISGQTAGSSGSSRSCHARRRSFTAAS